MRSKEQLRDPFLVFESLERGPEVVPTIVRDLFQSRQAPPPESR